MSRRFNTALIRRQYSYTVDEVSKLLDVHRNTVCEWFDKGLPKVDSHRPYLIHGEALKAFLVSRQESRRKKCALSEFFCFRCKLQRRPFGNLVDLSFRSKTTVMLEGLCESCETPLRKFQSIKQLPEITQTFDIPERQLGQLRDSLSCRVNRALGVSGRQGGNAERSDGKVGG